MIFGAERVMAEEDVLVGSFLLSTNYPNAYKDQLAEALENEESFEFQINVPVVTRHVLSCQLFDSVGDAYSGCLLMERYVPTHFVNCKRVPIGHLTFTCDAQTRNRILQRGNVTSNEIKSQVVKMTFFHDGVQLMEEITVPLEKHLTRMSKGTHTVGVGTGFPDLNGNDYADQHKLQHLLHTWIKRLIPNTRQLKRRAAFAQQILLFTHTKLRDNDRVYDECLTKFFEDYRPKTFRAEDEDEEEEEEEEDEDSCDFGAVNAGCAFLSMSPAWLRMLDDFSTYQNRYRACSQDFAHKVMKTASSYRNRSPQFDLYLSEIMQQLTLDFMRKMPNSFPEMPDIDDMKTAVNDKMSLSKTLAVVMPREKTGPVLDDDEEKDFALYGANGGTYAMASLCLVRDMTEDEILPVFDKTGKLVPRQDTHKRFKVDGMKRRLMEAYETRCPVWGEGIRHDDDDDDDNEYRVDGRIFKGFRHFRLVPHYTLGGGEEDDQQPVRKKRRKMKSPVTKEMSFILKRIISKPKGDLNETLQERMHWSVFIADVDIELPRTKTLAVVALENELVDLVVTGLTRALAGRATPPRVYLLRSFYLDRTKSPAANKLGYHVHAVMPSGWVLTTSCCKKLVELLECLRRGYPNIGLPEDDVFDTGVYPTTSHGYGHHMLRAPFQIKHDGSSILLLALVREADGTLARFLEPDATFVPDSTIARMSQEMPWNHRYAHAPQSVMRGKIVTDLSGCLDIKTKSYYNSHTKTVVTECVNHNYAEGYECVRSTINRLCYLFAEENPPTETTIRRMCLLLNTIVPKGAILALMKNNDAKKTGTSYPPNYERTVRDLVVTYAENEFRLAPPGRTTMPFCLNAPHSKPGTWLLKVKGSKTGRGMSLVLSPFCFSAQCRDVSVHPSLIMRLETPIPFPPIRQEYATAALRRNPRVLEVQQGEMSLTFRPSFVDIEKELSSVRRLYVWVPPIFAASLGQYAETFVWGNLEQELLYTASAFSIMKDANTPTYQVILTPDMIKNIELNITLE